MKKIFCTIIFVIACTLVSCGSVGTTGGSSESTSVATITTSTASITSTSTSSTAAETSTSTTKAPDTTKNKKSSEIPSGVELETYDEIEASSYTTVADLFIDTNAELESADKLIDTDELGEKRVKVKFSYEGENYEQEISYRVVDTTEPVILNSGWEPYVKKGTAFDLDSIVGYADNFDRAPKLTYEGEVDTNTVGDYPITATVTDSSGNSVSWDLTVLVLNEIPMPEDNNTRVSFQDFIEANPYENVRYGIDVSAWQTNVDYEKVKNQGCDFVIMRMGYYYGEIKLDDYYYQNMEKAEAAGLDIGVYIYTTVNTEEGAREQARWMLEILDGKELDFPVVFDWEEFGHFQEYGMNIRDLNNIFDAFYDELEKNGYKAMLYSSKNFLNNFWENRNERAVWLAHFVDETDYNGEFAIWQASAYGRMDGISGDVDMNIQFMSESLDK